jgi:DNA topoisomerase-1
MILIIAEKNLAGQRIAEVLGGKGMRSQVMGMAKYYSFTRKDQPCVVLPLRGHIVEVDFPKQYSYWKGTDLQVLVDAPILYNPSDPPIANLLREMGKQATSVILATDADREGESIGVEALRIVQEKNPHVKVERAYFSAMTPKELVKSFDELVKVDYHLSDSADSRREIDLIWGAVLTRYVSIMANRMGKEFISIGRVQTPVLALIVNREKERLAFEVKPYWEILAECEKEKNKFEAFHKEGKFWDEKKAVEVHEKVKHEKTALVKKVSTKKRTLARPTPFDTTQFLRSATGLGLTAGQAMSIAESLYMSGYISYPRTDNTVYPSSMELHEHLNELKNHSPYVKFVDSILAKPLNPSKGTKNTTDHPPIHPTKVPPQSIGDKEWKVFDLVARRFLATFMEDAQTENVSVDLDIKHEPFVANGQTILIPGWKAAYPFSTLKEVILPLMKEGEKVPVNKVDLLKKETMPPARYSQSALIKLMEELGLGTKCLHGDTLVKLFNGTKEETVSMSELFTLSRPINMMHDSAELRENSSYTCIGVSINGDAQKNIFPLISRRQTDPKVDRMKRITFADGSVIECTDNHPILCLVNSELTFIPASELHSGVTTASYHAINRGESTHFIEWETFASLCAEKTPLYVHGESQLISEMREKNRPVAALAREYGGYTANYFAYEKGSRPIPIGVYRNMGVGAPKSISGINQDIILHNLFPLRITRSLVRVLANMIGDGSLDREKVIRENAYDFRYSNTNPELLDEFSSDIAEIFHVKPVLAVSDPAKEWHKVKAALKIPGAAGRVLAMLFPEILKKRPWKGLPAEFYADFIGAFFDDEGHVAKKETKLFLSGTNHDALRDIQKMLQTLDINTRLDEKQHKLYVSQRQSLFNFLEKIPIISTYKKKRLIEMLSFNYRYNGMKKPFFVFERDLLRLIRKPLSTKEMAHKLSVTKTPIVTHLRKLLLEKKVKKTINGNNKDTLRKIKYVSLVDLPHSAYALLEETAIVPNLVTKKIMSIEDAPLPEFVYDITNSTEYPSFVLNSNLIVHNSTRHEIIQKLYTRKYIAGLKNIEPNQIAFAVIDAFEKHCKIVTDPKMTSELELEMDEVAAGKQKKPVVVDNSRKMLKTVLTQLLENKMAISGELRKALVSQDVLAVCPKCKGNLVIRKAGATGKRFLGCGNYPQCTQTYSLPQKGSLSRLDQSCQICQSPMVKLSGTRFKMNICLNFDCPSKDEWKKQNAAKAAAAPPSSLPATPSVPKAKPSKTRSSRKKI